ncbi:MAG: hypothetical protein ACHQIM_21890 [Sphingobacteriales bacterium]
MDKTDLKIGKYGDLSNPVSLFGAEIWLNKHVGETTKDSGFAITGVGWQIFLDNNTVWHIAFDNAEHATLFSLRWL